MNVQNTFRNTITDFGSQVQDGQHTKNVITQLLASINKSNIVSPEAKKNINKYFNFDLRSRATRELSSAGAQTGGQNNSDLLIGTTLYYLSDLNKYDHTLVNHVYNYGLHVGDIVTLILLNNIYDIDAFCKKKYLQGDQYHTVLTLKKLSALHKIQFNF